MQELQIDKSELEHLIGKLDGTPEVIRDAKRRAFEAAVPKLKAAVDSKIGGTGKVQGWQWGVVGSKGGYAAVRPKAKTFTDPTKREGNAYAVGYVTNAINSGHKFPRHNSRRKANIKSGKTNVPGKFFYEAAEDQASQVAQEAANEVLQAVKQHLEG